MVDIKNVRGELFYHPENSLALEISAQAKTVGKRPRTLDFKTLARAKDHVKLIGRHVMFWDNTLYEQRPDLMLFSKGVQHWVDLTKEEVIAYNIELLQQEQELGFDELVLDYVRFPATNKFGTESEKCEVIDNIVARISRELDIPFGLQVFGYTAWDHKKAGVGQRIESLCPYVDAIYPMLYPSHFWKGSFGFSDPSDNPYDIVRLGCLNAKKKIPGTTQLIPMLQAFSYSTEQIEAQIQAVDNAGCDGFVCWNPRGRYKPFS